MNQFTVESWVCDYGIYDNVNKCFIGKPISSYKQALTLLDWFEDFLQNT